MSVAAFTRGLCLLPAQPEAGTHCTRHPWVMPVGEGGDALRVRLLCLVSEGRHAWQDIHMTPVNCSESWKKG